MDFTNLVKLKHRLDRRVKMISVIPIFIFLALIFQMVLLIVGVNTSATWFNIVIVDQLFVNASSFLQVDNIVLSFMFFGALVLIVIVLLICAIFCAKKIKAAYQLLFISYGIDTILAILAVNYIQIAVHIVFLISIIVAIRSLIKLETIPKDLWGYED